MIKSLKTLQEIKSESFQVKHLLRSTINGNLIERDRDIVDANQFKKRHLRL